MAILRWISSRVKGSKPRNRRAQRNHKVRRLEHLENRRLLAANPIAGDYFIDEGMPLVLAATMTGADSPVSVDWDIDNDGEFDDASGANATMTWRNLLEIGIRDDGSYPIAVQATWIDAGGATQFDVSTGQLNIANVGPQAFALVDDEFALSEGSQTSVLVSAFDLALDDTDAGFLYSYDFDNDGTFEIANSADDLQPFIARKSGSSLVRVVVTDKDGGSTEAFASINVQEVAPTIDATGGGSVKEGSAYQVVTQVTDPGDDLIDSWTIDWGDGTTETILQHEPTPTHIYQDDGQYQISVSASYVDDFGASTISAAPLTANITNATPSFSSLVSSNDNVQNSSADGLISLTGVIEDAGDLDTHTITIDWGDGVVTTLSESEIVNREYSRTHQYTQAGIFTITATVTDDDGASSTQTTLAVHQVVSFDGDDIDESVDLDNDNDGIPDSEEDQVATPEVNDWDQIGTVLNAGNGTIAYSYENGSTVGWTQSVTSQPLSTLGFENGFEFQFTPDQASIRYLMIGLNEAGTDDGSGGYVDIDHAIYFSGTRFYVYQNGSYVGSYGQYSLGDTFSIRVDSGTLEYQRNGTTFQTTSVPVNKDYIVDTSAYNSTFSQTYSLSDVQITNLDGSLPLLNDQDQDGVINSFDLDSDNDGISDLYESGNAAAIALDANGDGKLDKTEATDSDQNGILDVFEGFSPVDSDGDGILDFLDLDSDNDGIPDTIEARPSQGYVTNDGDVRDDDSDGDGVLDMFDVDSVFGGTHANFVAPYQDANDVFDNLPDYLDTDSDGDGESDTAESGLVLDYRSTHGISNSIGASYADPDGNINDPLGSNNGLQNIDPDSTDVDFRSFADVDGDGIGDGVDIDNDNDGILDSVEGEAADGAIQEEQWIYATGSVFDVDDGTLGYAYQTGTPTGWTQSVHSPNFADLGYGESVRFNFDVDDDSIRYLMIGLTEAGTDDGQGSYGDIDHALYLSSNRYYVFENGAYRGYFGTFNSGDTFSLEVDGASLNYQFNGTTFYTSAITAGKDYFIDTSAYNSTISNAYSLSNVEVTNLDGSFPINNDSDGDSTQNQFDLDSDDDGESDLVESGLAAVIVAADTNTDGKITYSEALTWLQANINVGINDADANDDGLLDIFDSSVNTLLSAGTLGITPVDSDGDGTPDYLDSTT